jgi:hypothetical protein
MPRDGPATLRGIPVAPQGTACVPSQFFEVSGEYEWTQTDQYTLVFVITGARDLTVYSDVRAAAPDWDKVIVAPCGADTPQESITILHGGLD